MVKTNVYLPDGRCVSSGGTEGLAIREARLTQCVNSREELTLGSVCSAMLELTLLDPAGELELSAGQQLAVFKTDDAGIICPVGIFIAEKPVRVSAHCVKITAYDTVSLLDKDLTEWLNGLTGWPYSFSDLALMVCEACGVPLAAGPVSLGDLAVQAFSGQGITGRQIMQWIGEAEGLFCRANADGGIEFAWYTPKPLVLTPGGEQFYYLEGVSLAEYRTAQIEKVQIRLTDSDVGAVYPADVSDGNTYTVSGNYLLAGCSAEELQTVARKVFERLQGVSYTPCKITVPAGLCDAGDIITVQDRYGKSHRVYVMSKVQAGQLDTLECTGSPRRDSATAVNEAKYAALSGKVLELQMGVEGLSVENKDAAGKIASLEMNVEGIQTTVSGQLEATGNLQQAVTQVQQSAEDITVFVQKVQNDGVDRVQTKTGYTFDDQGLKICKSGEEMENRLDNTGMYVQRNGQVILQANNRGVEAADVIVRNYLAVGQNCRFEDYGGRTGCFWIGG